MTDRRSAPGASAAVVDTVFFLSDYGRTDEFVGVVHAVLRRLAHHALVIDLTHDVAPFDVRAGAATLQRAVPHLGEGVVLAVVDPGVGGERRGLAIEVPAGTGAGGPRWFVGPDNGLLLPAVERCGGIGRAVALEPSAVSDVAAAAAGGPLSPSAGGGGAKPGQHPSATFDGRDVFAPAVAALCRGVEALALGHLTEVASLVDLARPVWSEGRLADGRGLWRSEVTWVDRFGNVQLALPGSILAEFGGPAVGVEVERSVQEPVPGRLLAQGAPHPATNPGRVRVVHAFADLQPGEPGLLVDANDQVSLVLREGSAAASFGVATGGLVDLLE